MESGYCQLDYASLAITLITVNSLFADGFAYVRTNYVRILQSSYIFSFNNVFSSFKGPFSILFKIRPPNAIDHDLRKAQFRRRASPVSN